MPARSLIAILALLSLAACSETPVDYATEIAADRARKDEMFRNDSKNSPIRPGEMDKWVLLSYFPIDESFAVPAQLKPATERIEVQIPTSTGPLRPMERIGTLRFTLKDQALQLTAFAEKGSSTLFVPFSDLTSGTETYPAGRYMNLVPTATGIYIVDFNLAHHPYCYYNPEYECPLPPSENRLKIPVRAGEKLRQAEITVSR